MVWGSPRPWRPSHPLALEAASLAASAPALAAAEALVAAACACWGTPWAGTEPEVDTLAPCAELGGSPLPA